eukprot:TRINITY_DN15473_c3_g1_i2.p1 TRINITY_DN15473_c3_g1~~TRINITY_DN15473_c3_g1_i2.p1  ORF type:complete len:379 (-),score=36.94 TRINITY_DN15473_c3_g1_i2:373-1509(-)
MSAAAMTAERLLIRCTSSWRTQAPKFIIRDFQEVAASGNCKIAATNTWESRRYLKREDGFGFSFHHTILKAGQSTHIHYKNHVEAVLITSGTGTIELIQEGQQEGEGFAVFRLAPGVMYGLGGLDNHYLRADAGADMHVACAFNPPVDGSEDHDEHGVYPAIGADGVKHYSYGPEVAKKLCLPPDALQGGSADYWPPAQILPKTICAKGGQAVELRFVRPGDGAAMWRLARDAKLDLNSAYLYQLVCLQFAETSLLAVDSATGAALGYIHGHKPPGRDDTLFVWQIGVDPSNHYRGIASEMLDALAAATGVKFLEATITPGNEASHRLFQKFARRHNAAFDVQENWVRSEDFPEEPKMPGYDCSEHLYRIGPLTHEIH